MVINGFFRYHIFVETVGIVSRVVMITTLNHQLPYCVACSNFNPASICSCKLVVNLAAFQLIIEKR